MIRVTNRVSATLFIKTKEETYWIPPRVWKMELPINAEDIIDSSVRLKIVEVQTSKKYTRQSFFSG